ncbi:alpha/beta hydrolase [Flammeovirga kamogawensis]|uniref:Alpha/beta hydrolase n=1 Tax=Flammeovirga kamogawensis TaxID=373891 RepID=A0ABX8GZ82_9BACT|nr:hypothetical protein [Flammeovirga kamogawensis]MBB6459131.1 putative esterase [Flammeovirga kamogawensis]QWG08699.1 hypothetical protein KM029_07105 [Flammeovirga kamogawensis]TRX66992.1 hypothetical protein EO216_02150 [Flammeovirga kamogawensis]
MSSTKEWVSIKFDTPFLTNNTLTSEMESLWFVFHGYGQLAEHFIRRFDVLDLSKNHVVALQGLSKFYLDSSYKKVGASWMTKLEREVDILHQKRYIDEVFYNRLMKADKKEVKLNFFAFSQGGATLLRWLKDAQPKVDNLIMWAADLPSEFTEDDFKFLSAKSNLFVVLGTQDPFAKMIDITRQKELLQSLPCSTEFVSFEGGHLVKRDVLETIIEKLNCKTNF